MPNMHAKHLLTYKLSYVTKCVEGVNREIMLFEVIYAFLVRGDIAYCLCPL